MFIHVSQFTKCPLYVSPFLSSTSYKKNHTKVSNPSRSETKPNNNHAQREAADLLLTMGCPWAVLRSESGSCNHSTNANTESDTAASIWGSRWYWLRKIERERERETNHLALDPETAMPAGEEEQIVAGARRKAAAAEAARGGGVKTLVAAAGLLGGRRGERGKSSRATKKNKRGSRTERVLYTCPK